MARKKRVWYPGAMFHVMSRGNRQAPIFADESDYELFLKYMLRVREKHPFKVHDICLMTNHFHIAMETENVELSKIMQKILSLYAEEYNHRHDYTGHLFQGRYKAQLIEDERYFLEVSRYIHLNPVKAYMVKEPLAYTYGSYGLFVNKGGSVTDKGRARNLSRLFSELVVTDRVLGVFGDNAREKYRTFVESNSSHDEMEALIQKDMNENELWLPEGV